MGVNRPRHERVQPKRCRIVAKLQRTQQAALARTLRSFVLKGAGHIEDIDARPRIR